MDTWGSTANASRLLQVQRPTACHLFATAALASASQAKALRVHIAGYQGSSKIAHVTCPNINLFTLLHHYTGNMYIHTYTIPTCHALYSSVCIGSLLWLFRLFLLRPVYRLIPHLNTSRLCFAYKQIMYQFVSLDGLRHIHRVYTTAFSSCLLKKY